MGDLRAASTPALALLVARGVPHTVHEYEIEGPSGPEARRGARVAYGAAAAAALGAHGLGGVGPSPEGGGHDVG